MASLDSSVVVPYMQYMHHELRGLHRILRSTMYPFLVYEYKCSWLSRRYRLCVYTILGLCSLLSIQSHAGGGCDNNIDLKEYEDIYVLIQ
jgi:hypothetical protein